MAQTQLPAGFLGIRHIALFVRDLDASRRWYCDLLGFRVDWEPDAENLYLTSGADNLALHKASPEKVADWRAQRLDHFGFAIRTMEEVDAWAAHLRASGVELAKEPKTHRDGARSFYVRDPDGNVIQFIWHATMSERKDGG